MSNKYALAFLCLSFSVSVSASPYIPLSENAMDIRRCHWEQAMTFV